MTCTSAKGSATRHPVTEKFQVPPQADSTDMHGFRSVAFAQKEKLIIGAIPPAVHGRHSSDCLLYTSEIIRLLETYKEKAYIKLRFSRVYEEGEEGREISLLNSSKEFYCYEGKSDSASDFFGIDSSENKLTADLQAEEQDFLFKSCSFMKNPALKKTVCSSCSKKALCTCVCPGKKLRGGNCQRTASSLSVQNCSAGNERTYVSRRELRFAEDTKVGIDPYYGKKHIMIRKLISNLLSEYGPKSGSFESSDFREENFISEKQQAAREE